MARAVSPAMGRAMLAQSTDLIPLDRVTFEHPNLPEPIRLVRDQVDHVDGAGNTWTAFPFDVVFPDDKEETIPQLQLTTVNVSRDLLLKIRGLPIDPRPTATVETVTAGAFDTVEIGPVESTLLGYEADVSFVKVKVGPATDFLNAAFPVRRFLPSNAEVD